MFHLAQLLSNSNSYNNNNHLIKDTSLLVSIGTNCLKLFQPILILASTAACHLGNKTYLLTPR